MPHTDDIRNQGHASQSNRCAVKHVKNSNSHNFHSHNIDTLDEMHDVQTTAFCFEML